jgi:uncharacterized protein YehS (DUF1456 family)
MNNNDILKKLKIALELKDTDIIEILKLSDFEISKTKLNAMFRKEGHRNYKECGDQLLRRFLNGLITKKRGTLNKPSAKKERINLLRKKNSNSSGNKRKN